MHGYITSCHITDIQYVYVRNYLSPNTLLPFNSYAITSKGCYYYLNMVNVNRCKFIDRYYIEVQITLFLE